MAFKEEIKNLLQEKKYDELVRLEKQDSGIIRVLISLTYDKKSLICWRAIEALGIITREISKERPEFLRNIVGRLLWMIRDESGGIGWSSPEILGEIVKNNPEACSDIPSIIVSFHDEEMLSAGVLWAIGRMGKISTKLIEDVVPIILIYLRSTDQTLRGVAAWALGEIGAFEAVNELEKLKDDNNHITFYEEGELKERTIGEIATEAIEKLVRAPEILS